MCSLIGQRRTIEPNRNKSKSQSKVPSIMPHFRGSVGPKFVVPLCQVTDSFPYSSSVDFTHSARVIALIWFYDPQLKTHLKSVEDRYCSKKYIDLYSFFPTDDLVEYVRLVAECAPNTPLFYYHIPAWTHIPCRWRTCESVCNVMWICNKQTSKLESWEHLDSVSLKTRRALVCVGKWSGGT